MKSKLAIGVALVCSSFLLSGCLDNKNPDWTPPQTDEPDGSENPDQGGDTPDGGGDDDSIGQSIYSDGSPDYHFIDADVSPLVLRLKSRDISGTTIDFSEKVLTSGTTPWEDPTPPNLGIFIAQSGSIPSFFELTPEVYSIDTASNFITIPDTSFYADIVHTDLDLVGSNIRDYLANTVNLPNLAAYIDETAVFESGTISVLEQLRLQNQVDMYFPGTRDSNDDCLTADGTVSLETVSSTTNCNFVANTSDMDGVDTLAALVSQDRTSGPVLAASNIYSGSFKLISDTSDDSAGEIYSPSLDANIGRFQSDTLFNSANVFTLSFDDLPSLAGYVESDVKWDTINRFFLVEDNQLVRIGYTAESMSQLVEPNWIVNQNGQDSIENAVQWPN